MLSLPVLVACRPASPVDIPLPDAGADDTSPAVDTGDDGRVACPERVDNAISTTTGCFVGIASGAGEAYLGIPYAAAPVGDLRFLPPEPPEVAVDLFEAGELGAVCPQLRDSPGGATHAGEGDEDCLTLNVWRPSPRAWSDGTEGAQVADRPIVVFLHGGDFLSGSGGDPSVAVDPALAEGAVVVTLNYRLGPLGWLVHPVLSEENADSVSGNLGLLDAMAALHWVSDNADALGGDGEQILLAGHEAGGQLACALLVTPEAEGLFDAVALQSAPCGWVRQPLRRGGRTMVGGEAGESVGEAFGVEVGCSEDTPQKIRSCLRERDPEELRLASGVGPAPFAYHDTALPYTYWGPVVDRVRLPGEPLELMRVGAFARVPVIVGTGLSDGYGAVMASPPAIGHDGLLTAELVTLRDLAGFTDVTAADLEGVFGVEGLDPAVDFPTLLDAFIAFYSDAIYACPGRETALVLAEHTLVYPYRFGHTPSISEQADLGDELRFVFGVGLDDLTDEEQAMSAQLRGTWTWAAAGLPSIPGVGEWPSLSGDAWMVAGTSARLGSDPRKAVCEYLSEIGWGVVPKMMVRAGG